MTATEIADLLRAHQGQRVIVTWRGGEPKDVFVVGPVDQDGFMHSDLDCEDPMALWTPFEAVEFVAPFRGDDAGTRAAGVARRHGALEQWQAEAERLLLATRNDAQLNAAVRDVQRYLTEAERMAAEERELQPASLSGLDALIARAALQLADVFNRLKRDGDRVH